MSLAGHGRAALRGALFLCTIFGVAASLAGAQCVLTEVDKLTASDGASSSWFGYSVCVDGDVMAVGAAYDSEGAPYCGAVYMFRYDGSAWVEEQKLLPHDPRSWKLFGNAVAVSGDVVVVGAIGDNELALGAGAAYVFRKQSAAWVEGAKLLASDGDYGDQFGQSVSVDNEVIVVGAPYGGPAPQVTTGCAYVFQFNSSSWVETQKLLASDGLPGDYLGWSVSLSGNVMAVGAPFVVVDYYRGAAYLFRHDGSRWVEEQRVVPSCSSTCFFGKSVSIADDRVAGGSSSDYGWGDAYVFHYDGATWTEEARLVPSDDDPYSKYGAAIAILDDVVAVGAPNADHLRGMVHVFRRQGEAWTEEQELVASDSGPAGVALGTSVAIEGHTLAAGAPLHDPGTGLWTGAVYLYAPVPDLVLEAEPQAVHVGDLLTLSTFYGNPSEPALLAIVGVNGVPVFQRVAVGSFGADLKWQLSDTVPPGLSGVLLTFQAFGMTRCGNPDATNEERVYFY
ncbi:MAG: FG-GAP repeat protein [Planctomycetota bacterium]